MIVVARFEVPDGSTVQAYRFALDPTPAQARALASHTGAARFAHNHMLVTAKTQPAHARRSPHPVVGVDVGVKADSLLVVATPDGVEVARTAAPKTLTSAQRRLRMLQRRAARQHGPHDPTSRSKRQPSKRWQATQARIGTTHAHAAAIRRDVLHKAKIGRAHV